MAGIWSLVNVLRGKPEASCVGENAPDRFLNLGFGEEDSDYFCRWDQIEDETTECNPATGLPMAAGVDVAGNPWGFSDFWNYSDDSPAGPLFCDWLTDCCTSHDDLTSASSDNWHDPPSIVDDICVYHVIDD